MNIYKGMLFLQDYVNATVEVDIHQRPHYGAATVARKLAPPLGNRAASGDWFGGREASASSASGQSPCGVGGCG